MLEIKNIEVFGLERAIKASGNPMKVGEINTLEKLTLSDEARGCKLGSVPGGTGHDNFLKGIIVQFDVKYPQYWTPEAQRYHWLEIVSSESKMHRLTTAGSKENFANMFNKYVSPYVIGYVATQIEYYNSLVNMKPKEDGNYYSEEMTLFTPEEHSRQIYEAFMGCISNLPMGYEMWETLSTNYLQLKNIYNQRKNHKLKEDWGAFIEMCENLPQFLALIKGPPPNKE